MLLRLLLQIVLQRQPAHAILQPRLYAALRREINGMEKHYEIKERVKQYAVTKYYIKGEEIMGEQLSETWRFEMIRAETLAKIEEIKSKITREDVIFLAGEYRLLNEGQKDAGDYLLSGFWTGVRFILQNLQPDESKEKKS